jgi:hypothetical protein
MKAEEAETCLGGDWHLSEQKSGDYLQLDRSWLCTFNFRCRDSGVSSQLFEFAKVWTLERHGQGQPGWSERQNLLLQQAKEAWIADRKSWQPISDAAIASHFEC